MNQSKEFQITTIRFNNQSLQRIKDLCQVNQLSTSDLVNFLILEKHQDEFLKKIPL